MQKGYLLFLFFSGTGGGGDDGEGASVDYKDYTVGYAKSNKSQCRGCDEKIAKVYCPLQITLQYGMSDKSMYIGCEEKIAKVFVPLQIINRENQRDKQEWTIQRHDPILGTQDTDCTVSVPSLTKVHQEDLKTKLLMNVH